MLYIILNSSSMLYSPSPSVIASKPQPTLQPHPPIPTSPCHCEKRSDAAVSYSVAHSLFFALMNLSLRTLRKQCVAITSTYTHIFCLCIFTKYHLPAINLEHHTKRICQKNHPSLRHYLYL